MFKVLLMILRFYLTFPYQVYYVDHGFSEVIESNSVYKLHKQFCSLPIQVAKCKLAGKRRPVLSIQLAVA